MFKVGDRVKRTGVSHDGVEFGGEYIVTDAQPYIYNQKWLLLEGCGNRLYNPEFFLKLKNSPVVEYNKQGDSSKSVEVAYTFDGETDKLKGVELC